MFCFVQKNLYFLFISINGLPPTSPLSKLVLHVVWYNPDLVTSTNETTGFVWAGTEGEKSNWVSVDEENHVNVMMYQWG